MVYILGNKHTIFIECSRISGFSPTNRMRLEGRTGLAHDGFCTRPAQYKRGIVCLARDGWLETEVE